MGTRGSYGFRVNGEDKVTYNHFDSYPDGLGKEIMSFVKKSTNKKLKEIAEKVVLVGEDEKPTKKQIKECRQYSNTDVGGQTEEEWYCLLRDAQGNLSVYNEIPYMIDSHDFLLDSLFCEWAYIVNVDTNNLEIYEGFNKTADGRGRYADKLESKPDHREPIYYGVNLIAEIPFGKLRKINIDEIIPVISSSDYLQHREKYAPYLIERKTIEEIKTIKEERVKEERQDMEEKEEFAKSNIAELLG